MTPRLLLFLRGWFLVMLVSANTVQIAHQHYIGATLLGFAISMVWWMNAGSSGRSTDWRDGVWYAAGAALGTLSGLFLTNWWYGIG